MQKGRKREILLWDKHRTERELVEEMLMNIGCNVTAVVNKEDCLTALSKRKYDLVIFEQGLPDLDVDRFVEQLAGIDSLTPVAMMATLAIEFYEKRYGHCNIDFLIVKPFELIQLKKLVEDALELSERVRGTR